MVKASLQQNIYIYTEEKNIHVHIYIQLLECKTGLFLHR